MARFNIRSILRIRSVVQFCVGFLCAGLMAAAAAPTGAATHAPSQIRVAQMIPQSDITVQLQPQDNDQDSFTLSGLSFKDVSDYQSLPAGRYALTVEAKGKTLLRSTYGLGEGDRYTLALYGMLPAQADTNAHTFMAQLKRIFGGMEAHAVNGYLPQMNLLHDRVSSQSSAPQVRLAHLAPGIVPLQIEIQDAARSLVTKSLTYPIASEAMSVEGSATSLGVTLQATPLTVTSHSLSLEPQTLTDIFVVGGLAATHPIEVVIANPVSTARSPNPSSTSST